MMYSEEHFNSFLKKGNTIHKIMVFNKMINPETILDEKSWEVVNHLTPRKAIAEMMEIDIRTIKCPWQK